MRFCLVDRVAFSVFGQNIYWYGLIITLAIVLDFVALMLICKKYNYDKDMPYDLVLTAVVLGIIGARLFSVCFDSGTTIADFFKFRNGGMSIIGGLIGGLVGVFIYSKIKKVSFFLVTDALAPLVILAQAIGRWGNYFNSEVYGGVIQNESLRWFPMGVLIDGTWHYALFFYECILNLLGFVILILIFKNYRKMFGITTGAYLVYYGTVRFIMEPLRDSEFILTLGSSPISRIMSGVMVIVGLALIIYRIILEKNKAKKGEYYG